MGFLDGEDEGDGGDGGDGGGFEELICSEEPREIYSNVRQVSMGPQSKLTKNCTHRSTQSNRKRKENRNCRVSARSRESEVASNDDIDRLMPGVSPYMTFAQPRNLFWLWKKKIHISPTIGRHSTFQSTYHVVFKLERESGNKSTGMQVNLFSPFS